MFQTTPSYLQGPQRNGSFILEDSGSSLLITGPWVSFTQSLGEGTYAYNTVLARSGLLPVTRNQEDVYSTSAQGQGAWQRNAKENTSHMEPNAFRTDAWKDSVPSESHIRNCHSNPGRQPRRFTNYHAPSIQSGSGHFQTKPFELVCTLQGRKWIMLYSTETVAGFKEAKRGQPNWISDT